MSVDPASGERPRVSNLNWANLVTVVRIATVPVFVWLLLLRDPPARVAAAALFGVAAVTDSLDGYLARRFSLQTSLGAFLDPLADKLLVGAALIVLAVDGRVPWWAAGVIIGREIAVSALRVTLARSRRSLPASRMGKAKTWSQIVAVVVLTVLPLTHPVAVAVLGWAVAITLVSGYRYFADAVGGRAGVPWG